MKAFRPHEFTRKVRLTGGVPKVYIMPEALKDMYLLTKLVNTEISWMGTVSRIGDDFLIEEIFLLTQQVSAATTEIMTEGLGELATEIMTQHPDTGVEMLNKLRLWGHSHVYMGTTPSGQDDKQMDEFEESCDDFFIRQIVNKKGRMEFQLYIYDLGIEIEDAEWEEWVEEDDSELEAYWKDLIKDKVSPIVYKLPPVKNANYSGGKGRKNSEVITYVNNHGSTEKQAPYGAPYTGGGRWPMDDYNDDDYKRDYAGDL